MTASPEPQRKKGPLVWLDMDQAELDAAYDQSNYAPIAHRSSSASRPTAKQCARASGRRRRLRMDRRPSKRSSLPDDTYAGADQHLRSRRGVARRPWKDFAYAAELFVHAGAHFVVLDFINVIESGGDLMPMAQQVRRAVAWVYRNAKTFGGDPDQIYLSGHSSGAHLIGVTLITDWREEQAFRRTS